MNFLLPKLALLLSFLAHFPRFFSKIDGFENPLLKIDGFHGTHGTHANDATVRYVCMYVLHRVIRGVSTPKISNIEKVGIFDTRIHVGFTWHTQFFPL